MCGIGGIFRRGQIPPSHNLLLETMAETLSHRGPDGRGTWSDLSSGIGLCHSRLAVIDLSDRGAQPMTDADGRAWIVYNGEVYNYREIRRELEALGCRFLSGTDTEVVLVACLTWGVEKALGRFIGMFAFAIWIGAQSALYLVRDRMGIKPLYYGWAGDDLVFGSELKALCAHPGFERKVDARSLELFLMLQYIPCPSTVYASARKLPPGHILRIDPGGEMLAAWWDPDDDNGVDGVPLDSSHAGLSGLLDDSVKRRLVSDVPLGAFLSGGMDSGLVAAAMARTGKTPPATFTVSYPEDEYDEGPRAAEVAGYLGTSHRQVTIDSATLLERVGELPVIFDEPLSDPSALPMIVLSSLAREHVTVILSGDGGDELFGGYDRYQVVDRYLRRFARLDPAFRRRLAAALGMLPSRSMASAYGFLKRVTGRASVENFAGKWEKLLKLMVQSDAASAYQASIGIFSAAEAGEVLNLKHVPSLPEPFLACLEGSSDKPFIRRMMDLDTRTFLTDAVLTKVDRASMASGLEVRVPILDHRIVHWSRRAGNVDLFDGNRGKAPLRKLARRDLPSRVAERPKMGFTMPLDSWLRGELRELLENYLGEGSRVLENYFEPGCVSRLVREHLTGRSNNHEKLWNLLVFALWEEKWKPMAA